MTLRKRVLLALFMLAVSVLAVGSIATRLASTYLLQRIDDSLVNGPIGRLPASGSFIAPEDPCVLARFVSETVVVITGADGRPPSACPGQPILKIDYASLNLVSGGRTRPFTVTDERSVRYRIIVRRFEFGYVTFGSSLTSTDRTVRQVTIAQLAATMFAVGGAALVAMWLLRRGVRPLDRIVESADLITKGDHSHRLDLTAHGSDEIGRVGLAINAMLDELDRSLEQVKHSEGRLRQFVQDASHELRTPITSIRGYAELHQAGMLTTDDAVADAMNRIQHESVRMSDLVNDMLQLANFDVEPQLTLSSANLVSVVQAVVADAQAIDARWPIAVSTSRSAIDVNIDAHAFHQVLANLLGNVRAHTPAQTRTDISVTAAHGNAVVTLRDHGPGIDPTIIDEAFERFVQANPSRHRSGSGAGLGLSIARSIMTAHDGTIALRNHPDGGAEFKLTLPLGARSKAVH